jgi:hypothetical protein
METSNIVRWGSYAVVIFAIFGLFTIIYLLAKRVIKLQEENRIPKTKLKEEDISQILPILKKLTLENQMALIHKLLGDINISVSVRQEGATINSIYRDVNEDPNEIKKALEDLTQ